jgi:hypothetical protein
MSDDRDRIFPEELRVKAPRGSNEALAQGAQKRFCTKSEYVRQAVIRRLEEDGVQLRRRAEVLA